MIKVVIAQQLEDGENIYRIGDRVRVKMHPTNKEKPDRFNEYIGEILHIANGHVMLDLNFDTKLIDVKRINRIRFARPDESFIDTWDF